MQSMTTGTLAGSGSFRCEECGYVVTLASPEALPTCAGCGAQAFVRASLFAAGRFRRSEPDKATEPELEEIVAGARAQIEEPGTYLAFSDRGEVRVVSLERDWTRIGRSLAADVRFDDPTVSRRHALLVRQPDGVRVVDDRSLNGVFVNGERVEWRMLRDGDELTVGRHRLLVLEHAGDRVGA